MEAEGLELAAHRPQPVAGQRGRQRGGDQRERQGEIGEADPRGMGGRLQEARGHVLARRRLQVGGEQGEYEPIGLVGVAGLEIGGVRGQGPPGGQPGLERGRGRHPACAQ